MLEGIKMSSLYKIKPEGELQEIERAPFIGESNELGNEKRKNPWRYSST
jgi:hypothetical protein